MCIVAVANDNVMQLYVTNAPAVPVHVRRRYQGTWTEWRQVG